MESGFIGMGKRVVGFLEANVANQRRALFASAAFDLLAFSFSSICLTILLHLLQIVFGIVNVGSVGLIRFSTRAFNFSTGNLALLPKVIRICSAACAFCGVSWASRTAMLFEIASDSDSFLHWSFNTAWIQTGSAPVGLKCEPGADFISTGSAYKNRTCAT
jgi:hypothetical protein